MVLRLFVPEGEGQHPLTRKRPGGLPAQLDLITSPWRSSLAAAGLTGFLALVGRSRPGTFLRSAAFFSVVDLSWTAAGLYGQREINRGVFKIENITPEPGKLWQRTTRWTAEDATLAGGVLGIVTALNPRAFPGAYGMSRFIGVATVGCALGYKAGQTFIVRIDPRLMTIIESSEKVIRAREYERLQHEEAKAPLSIVGKLALKYHTSPYLQILRNPLQFAGAGGVSGMSSRQQHAKPSSQASKGPALSSSLQADTAKFTLIQVEFKSDDLTGPDLEAGYRAYKDSLQMRDESAIQEWLERIQRHKEQTKMEMNFLWKQLAKREQDFYLHVEEDRDKDIFRRELQLLNNMTADMIVRYAILGYHEADAEKQLWQNRRADNVPPTPTTASETPQQSAVAAQDDYQGPLIVTEQVRLNWIRQKEVLYHLEHTLSQYEEMQPAEGSGVFEHCKQLRQNAEDLKRNVEATERLLRWFEAQVQQAEDKTKRET